MCQDIGSTQSNRHDFPMAYQARGRAPLVLAIILEVPSRGSDMSSLLLFCPRTHPEETGAKFILAKFPLLVVSFSLCIHTAKMEVGFLSHLLMSTEEGPYSYEEEHRVSIFTEEGP